MPVWIFLLCTVAQAGRVTPPGDPGNGVAAKVNHEILTWRDVDDKLKLSPGDLPPENFQKARRGMRRQLVEEKLFLQAAEKYRIGVTDQEIDEIVRRKVKDFRTEEAFDTWLRTSARLTKTQFREALGRDIRVSKLYGYLVRLSYGAGNPQGPQEYVPLLLDSVTPEEIRTYYGQNRDQFKALEYVTAWRIGLQFRNEREKAEKRMLGESLQRKIAEGSDFEVLARLYSDVSRLHEDRRIYGDVELRRDNGFYTPATTALLFDQLQPGEGSGLVEDGQTFNLFLLKARVIQKEESFEEAQVKIRILKENQKRVENRRRLLQLLVERSYLEPADIFLNE